MKSKTNYCCETGCDDCPFDFKTKVNPNVPSELQKQKLKHDSEEEYLEILEKLEEEYDI